MIDIIGKRTLSSMLEQNAEDLREKVFLLTEDGIIDSYLEFNNKVNKLANSFLELGYNKGDFVVLQLPNCCEFLYAFFALIRIGVCVVPTSTLNTFREVKYIAQHSEARSIIVDSSYYDLASQVKSTCPAMKEIVLTCTGVSLPDDSISLEALMKGGAEQRPNIDLVPDDSAVLLYTSGTTDRPKGVLYSHGNCVYGAETAAQHQRLNIKDRYLIFLPLNHLNAQTVQLFPSVLAGSSIIVVEKFVPSKFRQWLAKFEPTVTSLLSPHIRKILQEPFHPTDSYGNFRIVTNALPLTDEEYNAFESRYNTRLVDIYGQTELGGTLIWNPIVGLKKRHTIGRPVFCGEIKIVDEIGNEVMPGQQGQMLVRNPAKYGLPRGYYKNEEATKKLIKDGWYYTGDVVSCDDDGFIYFLDRDVDIIKRSGENISASEIEMVLTQNEAVSECAVIAVPHPIRYETAKAFIVLKEGCQLKEDDIKRFCNGKLAGFKIPEYVEFVRDLPKTPVGKIRKKDLKLQERDKAGKR